jgi:hypothetical protein
MGDLFVGIRLKAFLYFDKRPIIVINPNQLLSCLSLGVVKELHVESVGNLVLVLHYIAD